MDWGPSGDGGKCAQPEMEVYGYDPYISSTMHGTSVVVMTCESSSSIATTSPSISPDHETAYARQGGVCRDEGGVRIINLSRGELVSDEDIMMRWEPVS